MMRWRVIAFFIDLQDGEHRYNVGDAFPREGHTVSEERIKELAGVHNKRKMPLIKLVEEPAPVKAPEPVKEPVKEAKKEKNERSGSSAALKTKSRKKK